MAQRVKVEWNTFCCSLCLHLLKAPVTTPCGHSYCSECIRQHWDAEEEKRIYSCPECSRSFSPRPDLEKSTMLVALMEGLARTGLRQVPAGVSFAGAEDVACDVCAGRKLKALKSCLDCRVSFCETHLQPHHQSSAFQRHTLVEPTHGLQENICTCHDVLMEEFCRSDVQTFCFQCFVEKRKNENGVSSALAGARELEKTRKKIQQLIHDTEEDLKELQRELKVIDDSADEAVKDSEDIFAQMICLLEKRRSEVQQQVRCRQEAEVNRVQELQKKLEQKITDLKLRDTWLEKISHTRDLLRFTYEFSSYCSVLWKVDFDAPRVKMSPLGPFEEVAGAASKLGDKLQEWLMETQMDVSRTVSQSDVPAPQLRWREDFLRFSRPLTLDPNTANRHILLSEEDRKGTHVIEELPYPDHPDRFSDHAVVMSRESLTGQCYWEVELGGARNVGVAVSDWDVSRASRSEGCELSFGFTDDSWALYTYRDGYIFRHSNKTTRLYAPVSSRVGVYLDYSKGLLSFYAVCGTMEFIHTAKATFTQPLHAALLISKESSAEVCDIWLNSQL